MPIDTVQQILHLRSKKNQQVMDNVARLWEIGRRATSAQDILDALHPWGKNQELFFHNAVVYLLIIIGMLSLVVGWFLHPYLPYAFSILAAAICFFIAYLSYESENPITEVIQYLEQQILLHRYHLSFNKTPNSFSVPQHPLLMIAKLKQTFPLFSQGNISNEIAQFASTTWHEGQTEHQVMLFQYHYVRKLSIRGFDADEQENKQVHKDQWGIFIFQMPALGFAASNRQNKFIEPYTQTWLSSDILVNQNLYIFGYDQHQLAKTISPSLTLKLSDFFQDYSGDIIYHFQENIFCYMGPKNLLSLPKQRQKIKNISTLRGHLRRLTLPEYEKFKQSMLNLIT